MKPQSREMIEGPQAFQRFKEAVKSALTVTKSEVLKDEERRKRETKKKRGAHKA